MNFPSNRRTYAERLRHFIIPSLFFVSQAAFAVGSAVLPQPVHLERDGIVYDALTLADGDVIVAGRFQLINGMHATHLARVNADGSLHDAWHVELNGDVRSIAVHAEKLYMAGSFSKINGQTRRQLAALDLGTSALLPWSPVTNYPVSQIAAQGDSVYLAGSFTTVNGVDRDGAAAVDATTGVLKPWQSSATETVREIIATPDVIFVAGPSWAGRLFALDPATGATITSLASASIVDIALTAEGLWIAGQFDEIKGEPRDGIALLDPKTFDVLPWHSDLSNASVHALDIGADHIYLTGIIIDSPNEVVRFVALSRTTGERTAWEPAVMPEEEIDAAAPLVWNDGVLIYGQVRASAAAVQRGIVLVDEVDGNLKSPALDAATAGEASHVARDANERLLIAGLFDDVGGTARPGTVRLTATGLRDDAFLPPYIPPPHDLVAAGEYVAAFRVGLHVSGLALFRSLDGASVAVPADVSFGATFASTDGSSLIFNGARLGDVTQTGLTEVSLPDFTFTGWNVPGVVVTALVRDGDQMLYGAQVGATASFDLLTADLSTAKVTAAGLDLDQPIEKIAADSHAIYISGDFSTVAGVARPRFARLDRSTMAVADWPDFPSLDPTDFASDGNTLWVADDDWRAACGGYLCRFDARAGGLDSRQETVDFIVSEVDVGRDDVAIVGRFQHAGGQLRLGVARFEREIFRSSLE